MIKEIGEQSQAEKQLDGFVDLVFDLLTLNGVPNQCIYTNSDLELPGFFRPNKKWDLLVVDNKELIIAIEFKSQVGPSFGNNYHLILISENRSLIPN